MEKLYIRQSNTRQSNTGRIKYREEEENMINKLMKQIEKLDAPVVVRTGSDAVLCPGAGAEGGIL